MTPLEQARFSRAQWRFLLCSIAAYAFFYITRKNLSMAKPAMLGEGVISTYALGLIMTAHGVLYGISRFVNGFWCLPDGASGIWATLLLMGTGFFIYGPQGLTGIIAANQATKDAAAMSNGFTGIMGYASTIVSGLGIAFIKEQFGWDAALAAIACFALAGMALFLLAWNAAPDGYAKPAPKPNGGSAI